jgi:hypothetical protein
MAICRDLLFHPQEHELDIPQIEKMLQKIQYSDEGEGGSAGGSIRLEFLAMDRTQLSRLTMQRYQAMHPTDRSTTLSHWWAVEQQHHDTFRNMYPLVLGRGRK